jgi:Fur family ferric uptake transcriptional regulator
VTVAPESPKLHFEDIHGAVALLRERGLRLSAARRQVLETLFALDAPASAEEIAARVGAGSLGADLASVYRNLEVLEREGIVRHVHLGHGPGLYALAGGREREYLVCERCGRVDAVEPERLQHARDVIETDLGYVVAFTHFPMVGRCAACASAARVRDAPAP